MRMILLRMVVLMLSFCFGVGITITTVKNSNCKCKLFFEFRMAACGVNNSVNIFESSDGKRIRRIMMRVDSPRKVEEYLSNYSKDSYQILDVQNRINPTTNEKDMRMLLLSKAEKDREARFFLISIEGLHITVLDCPSHWHALQFEYYLEHEYECSEKYFEYIKNKYKKN